MANITSYRDLQAWQLSMTLAEAIYQVTQRFPPAERYGLSAQLRRAAVSIPSQISEGHQHAGRAFRRYVVVALGSQAECETQLELARRLKLAPEAELEPVMRLTYRVGRILHGLARSLPRGNTGPGTGNSGPGIRDRGPGVGREGPDPGSGIRDRGPGGWK